ncbi:MAG: hypothetical protein AAFW65_06815 [Pseudomonadota bacterium]
MSDDVSRFARDLIARLSTCLGAIVLGGRCALEAATGGLVPRGIFNAAMQELRIAESILRRMALLIAVRMDITPLVVVDTAPIRPRPQRRSACSKPVRLLSLFDPWGSAPSDWPSQIEPRRGLPANWLVRRLDTINAVIENPEAMATRMARWMRGRDRRLAADVGPRSRPEHCWICRIGLPPGLRRGDRGFAASTLEGLDARAREAYPP